MKNFLHMMVDPFPGTSEAIAEGTSRVAVGSAHKSDSPIGTGDLGEMEKWEARAAACGFASLREAASGYQIGTYMIWRNTSPRDKASGRPWVSWISVSGGIPRQWKTVAVSSWG